MFKTFTSSLENYGVYGRSGGFHLVTETHFVSANPVIVHYLLEFLKEKNVILLAFQNTFSHYSIIANKLGVNLKMKIEDESLVVLDTLKVLHQSLNANKFDACFEFVISNQESPLRNMYLYVQNARQNFSKANKACALIIDSLNPLLDFGIKVKEIDSFLQYCNTLFSSPKDSVVVSCFTEGIDFTSQQLANCLCHKCSTLLSLKPLSTGQSRDIHGELSIITFSKDILFRCIKKHILHYKFEERDIKLFAPGLASSTL